jgi:hypothetical protein
MTNQNQNKMVDCYNLVCDYCIMNKCFDFDYVEKCPYRIKENKDKYLLLEKMIKKGERATYGNNILR